MSNITLDQFKGLLPKGSRKVITQEFVDTVNHLTDEDGVLFAKNYRENFMSFSKALSSGKYKTEDYMYAVKYVSYKLMEFSNIDSYSLTFPDRYTRLVDEWTPELTLDIIRDTKISPYVAAYNKNALVNAIMEQTMIPTSVLNAPLYQQAINVQADLMLTARSEMVRSTAATAIMTHCQPSEATEIKLSVEYDDETRGTQKKLVDHIGAIALNQQKMLASGMSIGEIQRLNLIKPEDQDVIDVEEDEDDDYE